MKKNNKKYNTEATLEEIINLLEDCQVDFNNLIEWLKKNQSHSKDFRKSSDFTDELQKFENPESMVHDVLSSCSKYLQFSLFELINNKCFNDVNNHDLLYHYTNIGALFNGIILPKDKSNKNEALSFLSTDYRYMNDQEELIYGRKVIQDFYEKRTNRDDKLSDSNQTINALYFLTSFSCKEDSIPMWSTYGNKGNGIALGLDTKILKEHLSNSFSLFFHCIYDMEELNGLINDFVEANPIIKITEECTRDFYAGIQNYITILAKHPSYKYEDEVRLLRMFPTKLSKTAQIIFDNFRAQNATSKVKYRLANNLIIPYVINKLPKEVLKTITIGPNLDMDRTKTSIEEYIKSLGFTDVDIIPSKAPFRTL